MDAAIEIIKGINDEALIADDSVSTLLDISLLQTESRHFEAAKETASKIIDASSRAAALANIAKVQALTDRVAGRNTFERAIKAVYCIKFPSIRSTIFSDIACLRFTKINQSLCLRPSDE